MPKKRVKKSKVTRKQKIKAGRESDGACGSASSPNLNVEYLDNPVKSECDKNDYRAMKLANGVRVVLITNPSVPENEKDYSAPKNQEIETVFERAERKPTYMVPGRAFCRIAFEVGSFSDPPEVPCVAQILCNIVLNSSQKYPQPNSFYKFMMRNGGSLALSTRHGEITSFLFDLPEAHLPEAIERFVQCFAGPLLRIEDVEKERNDIKLDEDRKQRLIDEYGALNLHEQQYIFDSIASTIAGQPGCNFRPRYKEKLQDQTTAKIYEEVEKFMKRHYSAHRMTVVIEARLPLDTLESYAKTYFTKIPSNDLPGAEYTSFSFAQCFDKPEFRMMYHMSSNSDLIFKGDYKLELHWLMPSGQKLYRSKPQQYLGWILNCKSEGSLLSYLEAKNWCSGIDCGINRSNFERNSVYSVFTVALRLTKEGHENRKQVLDAVFSYINLMRREGPQKRIYEEVQKIAEAKFRFDPTIALRTSLLTLHETMHYSTSSDYLTAGLLYHEYAPELINQCLDLLSPEKANIFVFDPDFYVRESVHCVRTALPQDWIDNWKTVDPLPEFKLPEVNPFHSDDYALIPAPENPPEYPTMIYSDDTSRIWYKLDVKFLTHESFVDYFICSPLPAESPENDFMMNLFTALLLMLSVKELYSATAAGLGYTVDSHARGLLVRVNGYNKKILLLAKEIFRFVADLSSLVTEDKFLKVKTELLIAYSIRITSSRLLARDVKQSILRSVHWSSLDKFGAAVNVDFAKFQEFLKRFPEHIRVDCLAQGNLAKADVTGNVRECIETLRGGTALPNTIPRLRINEIRPGTRCCRFETFEPVFVRTVVMNYYQFDDRSLRQSVMVKLFYTFLSNDRFERLRRDLLTHDCAEALFLSMECYDHHGYCIFKEKAEIWGIAKVSVVEEKIEKVRKALNTLFKYLSERGWKEIKEAFTEILQRPDACLEEEFSSNSMEIASETFSFDRRDRELELFKKLGIKDLREGLMSLTSVGPGLRKLSVQGVRMLNPTRQRSTRTPRASKTSNSSSSDTIPPKLELLTNLPREKEHPPDYYITDIEEYKRGLSLPLPDVDTVDDIAEAIRKDCNV